MHEVASVVAVLCECTGRYREGYLARDLQYGPVRMSPCTSVQKLLEKKINLISLFTNDATNEVAFSVAETPPSV